MQSVKPFWWHPILSLGPCSSQCMWPHPEPLLYPSSDWSLHPAASKGPWDCPTPAGLKKKPTITQHWLVLFSLSQSHGALVQSGNTFFTIDTKPSKSCTFSYFPQVLVLSLLEPLGQNCKFTECKMWRGQGEGLVTGKGVNIQCLLVCICARTCVYMSVPSANAHLCLQHSWSETVAASQHSAHSPDSLCLSFSRALSHIPQF